MPKQYWVEFDEEIHCDLCNEIAHIHFDCPSCGTKHAKTDVYGMSLLDLLTEKEGRFECQHCKTKFTFLYESENDFACLIEEGWGDKTWLDIPAINQDDEIVIPRIN